MMRLLLGALLLAPLLVGADELEYDMDGLSSFFDEVVIPSKQALRRLDKVGNVGPENATSECSSDALTVRILNADRKLTIIGGGPAGLAAAVYAARADLHPLIVAKDGGQLESTSIVDNYPGFDDGVDAVELIQQLERHAKRFGAEMKSCAIRKVNLTCRPFKIYCEDDEVITSSALVIATGASPRWLQVPGEQRLLSRGVHTCATCDGYFYKDRSVAVIGGGDTAMEQALFLARICSRVTLIHRGGSFRASKAMAGRVLKHPNILVLWKTVVANFNSAADPTAKAKRSEDNIKLVSLDIETMGEFGAASTSTLTVEGAFVAIGHTPNTELFAEVKQNAEGYLYTIPGTTVTSIPGVYAAGDVQDPIYRQAITSAGTGAMAAIDAERWLCEHGC